MQFIHRLLFVVFPLAFVFVSSCEEIGPDINLGKNQNSVSDTTYIESPVQTPEAKHVVIEEFTGVRCPNCPQGHQIINAIKTANPGKVIAVSFHPINSLGAPYPFSAHDFRSQKSQSLFDYLGQIGLEPAAGIDRTVFSGETKILLDKSKWTSQVANQLANTPKANIDLKTSYNSTSRELTMVVEIHYTQAVSEENKVTVLLAESDIVTAQLDGSVIDTFYTHKDIVREFISETQGDIISATLEPGRVVRKVYKKVLDAGWKEDDMYLVAYLHEFQNSKIIYHGKEIKIK